MVVKLNLIIKLWDPATHLKNNIPSSYSPLNCYILTESIYKCNNIRLSAGILFTQILKNNSQNSVTNRSMHRITKSYKCIESNTLEMMTRLIKSQSKCCHTSSQNSIFKTSHQRVTGFWHIQGGRQRTNEGKSKRGHQRTNEGKENQVIYCHTFHRAHITMFLKRLVKNYKITNKLWENGHQKNLDPHRSWLMIWKYALNAEKNCSMLLIARNKLSHLVLLLYKNCW